MRLINARFENFRLLRDLDLTFSTNPDRKLTVVRAENDSGKTTILTALQWAFFGDQALPGRGEGFRLHPIDWSAETGARVPITVTVEFEVVRYNKIGASLRESRRRLRIVRSTFEELAGAEWRRSPTVVRLFEMGPNGASPIESPDSMINDELPPELREVFFTDGDRALSFIESDVALSTKRERVQRAIRSLLGLGIIEDAIKHVKKASGEVNRHARQIGGSADLDDITRRLDSLAEEIAKCEAGAEDAKQQFIAFDEKLSEIEHQIEDALRRGDREKLAKDLDASKRSLGRLDERIRTANKNHSALFRGRELARDILSPVIAKAMAALNELHDKGKIPNTTIPVLEERLAIGTCICGETLAEQDEQGLQRRTHMTRLIDESRHADEIQTTVTELYYGSKVLERSSRGDDEGWADKFQAVVQERDALEELRDEEGRKQKALELQLASVPSTDVQGLRATKREYADQRDRFNARRSEFETRLASLNQARDGLTERRDRSLREQKKGARILAELDACSDIVSVLEGAYLRMTDEELLKVSSLMNALFLEMIGADPEQGAIIKKAQISREFDIIVSGPAGRKLNPDRDLNGASRRALTLAFILALTKVSEVEAPNVIDTPLGMMSGYVKRSVLRTTIRESAQPILFLTHSEIAGCEEIIDAHAGAVQKLTNPAHYPKMLVNDSGVRERKVLKCGCDHRGDCAICQRRSDIDDLVAQDYG